MLKLLSLFSGIGAFEKALENIGEPYELVNYCEIDKYASKAYSLIHNLDENMNLKDVTTVHTNELPDDIDIITYGFPCQDISNAGKQKGFTDDNGNLTRSGLFFEALRIIEDTQPRIAIAENVKALTGKKFTAEFKIVLDSLNDAGYKNYWAVLNAKDYGIPQNRERVFIISIRNDIDHGFQFPEKYELKLRLKDLLEDSVDEKYFLGEKTLAYFIRNSVLQQAKGNGFKFEPTDGDCICGTIGTKFGVRMQDTYIDETARMNPIATVNNDPNKDIKPVLVGGVGEKKSNSGTQYYQQDRVYDSDAIAMAHPAQIPGGSYKYTVNNDPVIQRIDIPQTVRVRKYEVDKKKLVKTLRHQKKVCGWSNKDLAEELELPVTAVEHWFRTDKHFSVPDPKIWEDLKWLLEMDDIDEFDEAIMTFEDREGTYEKAERCYHENGIAPTITVAMANEKIITASKNDFLPVKEATKKGYAEAHDGDYVNLQYPNSETRRGRVGDQCANTLLCNDANGVVIFDDYNQKIKANQSVIGAITPNFGSKGIRTGTKLIVKGEDATGGCVQVGILNRPKYHEFSNRVYSPEGCARTLMGEGGNQSDKTGQYIMPNLRIRKLTPKECFRLMGFDDKDCDILVKNKISNTQIYKMAGNSIVVDVLEEIFVELLNQYDDVFPAE